MTRALALVAVVFAIACGAEDKPATPDATSTPSMAQPTPTPTPTPVADPCALPEGSLRGDAAKGEASYARTCSICHGPDAPPLTPPARDHKDCAYMTALTDEHLFNVICAGGASIGKPTMPPWGGVLPKDEIRDLVGHLRGMCPTP